MKPDDVVHVCERQMQVLEDQIEASMEDSNGAEARISYFKALRCYFVGHTYAKLGRWKEAGALFKRTCDRVADANQAEHLNEVSFFVSCMLLPLLM